VKGLGISLTWKRCTVYEVKEAHLKSHDTSGMGCAGSYRIRAEVGGVQGLTCKRTTDLQISTYWQDYHHAQAIKQQEKEKRWAGVMSCQSVCLRVGS